MKGKAAFMKKGHFACILTVVAAAMWGCGSKSNSTGPKNNVPLPTMVTISNGTFQMGDTNSLLLNQGSGSTPVHSVTLGTFTISQTLVTQAQYKAAMDTNPSFFKSSTTLPVETVTWYDAVLYCNAISKASVPVKDTVYTFSSITGTPGAGCTGLGNLNINYTRNGYRLPTEAEYEYACRAGNDTTDYYWGRKYPPMTTADTQAISANAVWYLNSPNSTQPVATKKPNAWRLYDMSGNVYEWCNDWWGIYSDTSQTNPTGAASGSYRVLRGGTWDDGDPSNAGDDALCSAFRSYALPEKMGLSSGFRVVCGPR